MKNKKLLLLLIGIIGVLFPKDVFADNNTIKFTTAVNNWSTGTDLVYTCGSSSINVSPTVYIGPDASHLTATSCTFAFNDLNYTTGSDFIIVEEFNFSSYHASATEFENITIEPGSISSATIDYGDDTYMFGSYTYNPNDSEVAAVLYNMNEVDPQTNAIIGPIYVHDAYIDNAGKDVTMDFGTVKLPTYRVIFHYAAKGNIANTYGTFYVTEFRTDSFAISGSHGGTSTVDHLSDSSVPLTKAEYDALIATSATYEGVARDSEYVIDVEAGTESTSGTGVRSTDVYITATLESDGSQTGLLYTVVPFVILISLVVVGYLIIRNNEIEDKEII